jgi:hypothetical protein
MGTFIVISLAVARWFGRVHIIDPRGANLNSICCCQSQNGFDKHLKPPEPKYARQTFDTAGVV